MSVKILNIFVLWIQSMSEDDKAYYKEKAKGADMRNSRRAPIGPLTTQGVPVASYDREVREKKHEEEIMRRRIGLMVQRVHLLTGILFNWFEIKWFILVHVDNDAIPLQTFFRIQSIWCTAIIFTRIMMVHFSQLNWPCANSHSVMGFWRNFTLSSVKVSEWIQMFHDFSENNQNPLY